MSKWLNNVAFLCICLWVIALIILQFRQLSIRDLHENFILLIANLYTSKVNQKPPRITLNFIDDKNSI